VSGDADRLRAMHAGPQPLVLPNAWDPVSARTFADAGFAALATSSSAVAATLGCRDGETPKDEMFAAVTRIARSVNVPVTADIENGYGLTPGQLVQALADCGVAGCNLEDSDPVTGALTEPARQAEFIAAVRAAAGSGLVINARVDVYVRPRRAGQDGVTADAIARARAYLAAGADCTYPILAPPEELLELVQRTGGPVNAMHRPGGPSIADLAALGVARITFGGGLHSQLGRSLRDMASALAAEALIRMRRSGGPHEAAR
jgi:2-methylisocitrate lyase-like PEP mutase family enzyme